MDDSEAGPSESKKPRIRKFGVRRRQPLTDAQLEQLLLNSDDDISDPDYTDSEGDSENSEDSDIEEIDSAAISDTDNDNVLLSNVATPQNVVQPRDNQGPSIITWDANQNNAKDFRFTKKRELLVQPNGKI